MADLPDSQRRQVLSGLAAASIAGTALARAAGGGTHAPVETGLPQPHFARGSPGYEDARRHCAWDQATPSRFPDLIVRASSRDDVAEVLRYARARGMTVAIKGSGHNYTSTYLHDGGVLLDVSALKRVALDAAHQQVDAQPGITSSELAGFLAEHGRAFPTGHHGGVGLGGYLLGGGMGWNGESWGQFACFNVTSLEVVTARGEALEVNARSHPDLYWAARGAGPLFCGVVTGFRLETYPAPIILSSQYSYPLASAVRIGRWLQSIANRRTPNLDLFALFLTENPSTAAGVRERRQTVLVYVLSYAKTPQEAQTVLQSIARTAPPQDLIQRQEMAPVTFAELYAESLTGPARRTAADTAWTDNSVAATEVLAKHFETVPSAATVGIINYRMPPSLPRGAACSMAGSGFIQWLGQWDQPLEDEANLAWVQEAARRLEPYTIGAYVNESDIIRRPERLRRCFAPGVLERIRRVRNAYDPRGLFALPTPA